MTFEDERQGLSVASNLIHQTSDLFNLGQELSGLQPLSF